MVDEIAQCKTCGATDEARDTDPERMVCTQCGSENMEKVGEKVFMRGKELYLDSDDIDDLIDATQQRLDELKELKADGYEVWLPSRLRDDYVDLVKYNDNYDPDLRENGA